MNVETNLGKTLIYGPLFSDYRPRVVNELELLAVTLVDLRASADQLKRSVTNAQASVEQLRHKSEHERLVDIASCLDAMEAEATVIIASVASAREPLGGLMKSNRPPSKPSR